LCTLFLAPTGDRIVKGESKFSEVIKEWDSSVTDCGLIREISLSLQSLSLSLLLSLTLPSFSLSLYNRRTQEIGSHTSQEGSPLLD
jgi:hypothetical protein